MNLNALKTRILPLALVGIVALLMWLLDAGLPNAELAMPWPLAAGFAALGALVAVLGVLEFRKAQTTVDPRTPHKTATVVTSGVYKLSRNPMYLGFALWLLAWLIWPKQPHTILLVVAFVLFMNRFQIGPEERVLASRFGDEYRDYCNRVPRWIGLQKRKN